MTVSHGGPAFPHPSHSYLGMTVWDWYYAALMREALGKFSLRDTEDLVPRIANLTDQMMTERLKRTQGKEVMP